MTRFTGKHGQLALLGALVVVTAFALSAASAPAGSGLSSLALRYLSTGAVEKYYMLHPTAAPEQLQARLASLRQAQPVARQAQPSGGGLFNADSVGLPQHEESITACSHDPSQVLGGANDYRAFLDPELNLTGWYYSSTGGASLTKEGLLPSIDGASSSGDPVESAVNAPACTFYAGDLNFGENGPGIGVYKTTPAILNSPACRDTVTLSDPDCWPTRRLVVTGTDDRFADKPWIYAGYSGGTLYVWVTWSDFDFSNPNGLFTSAIMASRCDADLTSCTTPQPIGSSDQDVLQFSDVTIGPDGRTYVTWTDIKGGQSLGQRQMFTHKLRIAPAGSIVFGPTRVVATEKNPLQFGGNLQADDFRAATYPKNEVATIGAHGQRIFVIWDACIFLLFSYVCEDPVIKLSYSDDDGASWTEPQVISGGGVNYFPTISVDRTSDNVVAAWYTNRYDAFQNAQDVDLRSFPAAEPFGGSITRVTSPSKEPEADPWIGGYFIGDYFEVFANAGKTLVHFNANYRQVRVLGGPSLPTNQQDNFLTVR